jgi:hypothetical protein
MPATAQTTPRSCSRVVTILDRDDFSAKPGSVGIPPPFYEMRIVDGDGRLTTHGVDGDDTAVQQQRVEQFRNDRDLAGFWLRCPLSQRDAAVRRPGTDHVQRPCPSNEL